jgi:hypothetical protein
MSCPSVEQGETVHVQVRTVQVQVGEDRQFSVTTV